MLIDTAQQRALWTLALLAVITSSAYAQSPLPLGFGAVKIGQPWAQIENQLTYKDLTDESTLVGQLAQECGYRAVAVGTGEDELLITTNDHIVTELAYVAKLQQGANVSAVAELVMQTYGAPRSAAMRDALGQATINRSSVAHIELGYESEHPVAFYISGPSLWQYQVTIRFNRARWHENRNNRCVRQKESEKN
ncbi:MAG: hypothetical protein GKR94_22030 [Gammaproteobacteria bacterium]|nr:hypothetical protein [Gammaproteobacteria bacterium]